MQKRNLITQCATFILLCISLTLIWLLGPRIQFNGHAILAPAFDRTMVNTILILIWLFFILFNAKKYPISAYSPKTSAALTILNQRFEGAIQFLKRTVLSGNKQQSKKNLNDLPWYVVMGPPAAGKTTLLAKANLPYILTKYPNREADIDATDLCDWWVTRDTVFIDTTGDFCPISKRKLHDNVLWQQLFTLIKKAGKERLKGILLVLDLPRTAKLSANEQRLLYQNIRANLQIVNKTLQTNVPVYLACNQCDRVLGFQAFFDDLGIDEQQQIWGVSFDNTHTMHIRTLLNILKQETNALLSRLHERLLWRLHHERNSQKRLLIKDFPVQLEMLFKHLPILMKHLYQGTNKPWLRGLYFMSSLQKNDLEDYLLFNIQKNLNWPAVNYMPLLDAPQNRSNVLFSGQLLQRLLKHDQDYLLQKVPSYFAKIWRWRLIVSCMAVVMVTCIVTWGTTLHTQIQQINTAQSALAQYKTLSAVIQPASTLGPSNNHAINQQQIKDELHIVLPTLQAAQSSANAIKHMHMIWTISLLNKNYKNIYDKTDKFYQQTLQSLFSPIVTQIAASELAEDLNHPDPNVYTTLEIYLMLGTPGHLNQNVMKKWLSQYWETVFLNDKAIQQQLNHYTTDWLATDIKAATLDSTLLAQAKSYITNTQKSQAVIAKPT